MRWIHHPVLCNYYVTYRCNASCHFCDIWEKPSPYVKIEDVRENLQALKRMGVKVIDFTGGEPLLHRELPQFLALAKEMGFITTITTNALLYPKRAEALQGLVDMLHFSLDYADAEKHDAVRGVGCFDFVMRSIDIALSLGERPDILFTAMNENIGEIEKVWTEITQPNRLMLILNPIFDYDGIPTQEQLSPESMATLRYWAKKPGVYLNEAFLTLREKGGNHVEEPVCKAGSSTVVISPMNELVVPCYHLGEKAFPIHGDLEALYASDEVQHYIAMEGRMPACEGCAINCYMQPSFAVDINSYFWKALPSTLKYNRFKGTWKKWPGMGQKSLKKAN